MRNPQGSKSVVLLSGGLDSCVGLAWALAEGEAAVLHVNYGQRTQGRELKAFHDIADHYDVEERLVCDLAHLEAIGGTSLIDRTLDVETGLPRSGEVPSTYVPFRNAHLLCIAVSWAEVIGADGVVIGAVEEDGSGYPDCTRAFYEAFAGAAAAGTRPETSLTIHTPLIDLDKAGIVGLGRDLKAPLHLSWSCYVSETAACGECESCRLRLRGFERAGLEDPITYR